jgi:hypothetical protein
MRAQIPLLFHRSRAHERSLRTARIFACQSSLAFAFAFRLLCPYQRLIELARLHLVAGVSGRQHETKIAVGCVESGDQPNGGNAVRRKIGVIGVSHKRQVRRDRQIGERGGPAPDQFAGLGRSTQETGTLLQRYWPAFD